MSGYNKFQYSKSSKFGAELSKNANLTNIMRAGVSSAIPIWEMLGMSEEDYNLQYHNQNTSGNSSNNTTDASNNETETPVETETESEIEPEVQPEVQPEPEVENSSTDISNNST